MANRTKVKPIQGQLDSATREQVLGWAKNQPPHEAKPVTLVIMVDGTPVGRTCANIERPDLAAAGIGPHAFAFTIPIPLSAEPHSIAVCTEGGGVHLDESPVEIRSSLNGNLDIVSRDRITGWVQDAAAPATPVSIAVTVDGTPTTRILANAYRDDLARNGIGNGRHCFDLAFIPPLPVERHVIELTCEASGLPLPGSPFVLDGPQPFGADVRGRIAAALDNAGSEAALQQRIEFLATQMARLLALRSDRASRRGERLAAGQFRRRWIDPAAPAAANPLQRRALIFDTTLPDPTRDAGSGAILSHALSLQRLGYEVVFVPLDMAEAGARGLEAHGIASCHAPWFGSAEEVLRAESHAIDLVYLHRVTCAFPYIALIRRYAPRARIVYNVADLHHLRLFRQAVAEDRPELKDRARLIREQELWAATQVDAVITHAEPEAAILRTALPLLRPHVIPWAIAPRPIATPFAQRHGLAFVGNYSHAPNVDAALFLIDEVMPLLLQHDPGMTLHLVGSAMPETLKRTRPGVVALGWVNDLDSILGTVRLTVAPLTYGAGIKGKVLESLAAGTPCVCTPVAAEGIALGPALRSLVATRPAALAASILRLHTEPALHAACVQEGLDYVRRTLGTARIDELMRAAIG